MNQGEWYLSYGGKGIRKDGQILSDGHFLFKIRWKEWVRKNLLESAVNNYAWVLLD